MNILSGFNLPDLSRTSSGTQTGQTSQVNPAVQPASSASTTPSSQQASFKSDQANLSASGLAASASSANAPNADVRLNLVSSIQASIQAGTYNVPASEVAGSIIKNMLGQNG